MPVPIRLRRSATTGVSPSSLEHGEVAINYADARLFYKNDANEIKGFRLAERAAVVSGGTVAPLVLEIATVPGPPSIDGASGSGGTTTAILFADTDDGGSAITSYQFTFNGVAVTPSVANLTTLNFTFAANYSGQTMKARAVNAVGAGPYGIGLVVG